MASLRSTLPNGDRRASTGLSIPARTEKGFAQMGELHIERPLLGLQLSHFRPALDLDEVNKPFQQI
jgi:hypothetical protein